MYWYLCTWEPRKWGGEDFTYMRAAAAGGKRYKLVFTAGGDYDCWMTHVIRAWRSKNVVQEMIVIMIDNNDDGLTAL